jgi:hypothetical protein
VGGACLADVKRSIQQRKGRRLLNRFVFSMVGGSMIRLSCMQAL